MGETPAGLVSASAGWFLLNAGAARWFETRVGAIPPLAGHDEYEAETFFPMLGMAIRIVNPGEPTTIHHWETEREHFLARSGEAVLILEGEERPLEQWDFVHCPPQTQTRCALVGAGDAPCVLLCTSARQFQKGGTVGL